MSRILLVDDNPFYRVALKAGLEKTGTRVSTQVRAGYVARSNPLSARRCHSMLSDLARTSALASNSFVPAMDENACQPPTHA